MALSLDLLLVIHFNIAPNFIYVDKHLKKWSYGNGDGSCCLFPLCDIASVTCVLERVEINGDMEFTPYFPPQI